MKATLPVLAAAALVLALAGCRAPEAAARRNAVLPSAAAVTSAPVTQEPAAEPAATATPEPKATATAEPEATPTVQADSNAQIDDVDDILDDLDNTLDGMDDVSEGDLVIPN